MLALVTGHRGFVGRHVMAALIERGYDVTGCDLLEGNDCRQLFDRSDKVYDLVVHCAAVVGGRQTISHDPLAVAVDLAIDSDFFRWAVRTEQRRLVYFSSCAAYPVELQVEGHQTPESDISLKPSIGTPDLTYGWAKITGEMLAEYAREHGIAVHVLRPFSGYGEDQALDYPFPSYIARAKRQDDPFEIWGDGNQVRDFVHIDDVVGTLLAVIDQDYQHPLNIGWGRATTFNELATLITEAAGYSPASFEYHPNRPTGPAWRVADTENLLGLYIPKITLEEGIARALGS